MIRSLLWAAGGLMLGLMIHIMVIFILPNFATSDLWSRVVELGPAAEIRVLDPVTAGAPNPMGLDPALAYAICRLDLHSGPGSVTGILPDDFWSVSVFGRDGTVIYSTTSRSSRGNALDLSVFNSVQIKALAKPSLTPDSNQLVVQSKADDVFVAVRLMPPHPEMLARYRAVLAELNCGNIPL